MKDDSIEIKASTENGMELTIGVEWAREPVYNQQGKFQRVYRTPNRKGRVYIYPKGETVMQHFLIGRHTRPYTQYKKEILPVLRRELGLPKDAKFSWSRYAGCSGCPCSPGFIADSYNLRSKVISVSVA